MTSNRRNFERFSVDMVFWIKPLGEAGEFKPFEIENISGGGLLAITDHDYRVGSRVKLSFELPQHTELIEAEADVRHARQVEDRVFHIGLEFTHVEGLPTALLIEYLEEIFK